MLPKRTAPEFPNALKAAREAAGLSLTELAVRVGISPVMPGRYENPAHSCFGRPNDKTWKRLNEVLFDVKGSSSTGSTVDIVDVSLGEATVEDLVNELKARGAKSVQIAW